MYIFDFDGTLSIVGDRLYHLLDNPKDWDCYFNRCDEDEPNTPILNLCRTLIVAGADVRIATGRRECTRDKSMKWLIKHNIFLARDEHLYMRKDGDTRHDHEIKPPMIEPFRDQIEIIFDDRTSMVNLWRELGFTCCQVAQGDF